MAAISEIVMGGMVPRRSACLPATGDSTPSIAAAARNVPAIDQGGGPEGGQAQRGQDVQHAEGHPGQQGQPQAGADPPVAHRGQCLPQPLWPGLMRRWHQEGHHHQHRSGHRGHGEDGPRSHLVGRAPEHRAEQRPAHGGAQGRTEHFPPPLLRRHRGQPGQACRPAARPAQALDEPGRIEDRGRGRKAEDQRRHAHQPQPEQHDLPAAQAGREQLRRAAPRPECRGRSRPPASPLPTWTGARCASSGAVAASAPRKRSCRPIQVHKHIEEVHVLDVPAGCLLRPSPAATADGRRLGLLHIGAGQCPGKALFAHLRPVLRLLRRNMQHYSSLGICVPVLKCWRQVQPRASRRLDGLSRRPPRPGRSLAGRTHVVVCGTLAGS